MAVSVVVGSWIDVEFCGEIGPCFEEGSEVVIVTFPREKVEFPRREPATGGPGGAGAGLT